MAGSLKRGFMMPVLALMALGAWPAGNALAGVDVHINIGPPQIVVDVPAEVVVVPDSRVYFVPDPQIDIFFYAEYWWSPRGSRWYRARNYNGPWVHIAPSAVPRSVVYMPRDYRTRYANGQRYPYEQWRRERPDWERRHREIHRHWVKEREKEWRGRDRNDRYNRYGNRYNGRPGPGPGYGKPGPGPGYGKPGPGPGYGKPGPGPGGPGPGPGKPGPGNGKPGPGNGKPGPGGPGPGGPGPGYGKPGPGGPGPGPGGPGHGNR